MNIHPIVNSLYNSCTYVLHTAKCTQCCLIDCGDMKFILEYVCQYNLEISSLFITHTHYDHIYGIKELMNYFPGCIVYTSEWGVKGLASDKLNLSRYHNEPIIWTGDNINVLHEGDNVELFANEMMRVMETPGHDRSCLTYKSRNNLFTGDSFIPGLKVVSNFPNSNNEDAELSLRRIRLLSRNCHLYPGHIFYNNSK